MKVLNLHWPNNQKTVTFIEPIQKQNQFKVSCSYATLSAPAAQIQLLLQLFSSSKTFTGFVRWALSPKSASTIVGHNVIKFVFNQLHSARTCVVGTTTTAIICVLISYVEFIGSCFSKHVYWYSWTQHSHHGICFCMCPHRHQETALRATRSCCYIMKQCMLCFNFTYTLIMTPASWLNTNFAMLVGNYRFELAGRNSRNKE